MSRGNQKKINFLSKKTAGFRKKREFSIVRLDKMEMRVKLPLLLCIESVALNRFLTGFGDGRACVRAIHTSMSYGSEEQ